ncbi:WD40-repeat-containing domain protein [Colletotrichum godetiae]|uniref:WD40-repeat-containing domain protein n=1 Tax=Colletotrichum godetiae TaxID=1209918 RepID=A0AAJ0EPQ8_9PEZI|nr:WD40-repeat-containing domain protein [Colletotrichum godetiae]KAK1656854.1 WD40-repeat-containing domain protein [Colletotrichum godetiae]
MLAVEPDAITSFLAPLRSIIDARREKHQSLKLFHTSFRDFLLSAGAGVFRINRVACHRRLGFASLELLHSREPLRGNCCDLSPGTELREIPTQLINDRLPSQVQYACLHWVGHLTQAQYALRADDHVHQFLEVHFLHWIEALAILGSATKSIQFTNALLSLKMDDDSGLLRDLIQDIKSFLTSQILSFEAFPRQVYFFALLFAPSGSVVRKTFKKWIPKFITTQPAVGSNWTSRLHSFRIADKTSTYLYSLCFSPNEKLLALGLSDGAIVIRTILTGTLLQVIRAHKDAVIALALFSDSRRVASSSMYSLMIHLAESGELIEETASMGQKLVSLDISRCSATVAIASWGLAVEHGLISLEGKAFRLLGTIDGKDSLRPSITVSQDSKLVAGSAGRYIKIWSIHGGTCLQALGDSHNVPLVLFLPSGIFLSRICDGTIRFWCCSQKASTLRPSRWTLFRIYTALSRPHQDW